MPTREINSAVLHYEDRGSGLPVVLLHGFPLDGRIWTAQLEALSRQYRVIVPDLRGFGQSKWPGAIGKFTMATLAEDIHTLLVDLKALPCVLGGLSMGGYVTLAFTAAFDADLRGLMFIDTKAEADTPAAREGRDKMIALVRESGSPAVAEQMMPRMLAPVTIERNPRLVATAREIMTGCRAETIENALTAMRDRLDRTALLATITVPSLVVVGAFDAIIPPATATAMAAAIPGAQLKIIPDAGHLPTMEQPELLNQVMKDFLATLRA
jgi:pimeloyl-ACP methyl ester carboxylesterase